MKKLNRKKHNRRILRELGEQRAPLTDRKMRDKVAEGVAAGTITKKQQRGVESTLRQSRREIAAYNRAHVHTGDAPEESYAPAMDLAEPEQKEKGKAAAIERAALRKTESEGAKESSGIEHRAEQTADRVERGEKARTHGVANLDDSENVRSGREGKIAFTGPRFQQTERAAARKVQASIRWSDFWSNEAWGPFQTAEPIHASVVSQIENYQPSEETRALFATHPYSAFLRQLGNWLRKFPNPDQSRHESRGREAWRQWQEFRRRYRTEHEDDAHPDLVSKSVRYLSTASVPGLDLTVYTQKPRAPALTHVAPVASPPPEPPRWTLGKIRYRGDGFKIFIGGRGFADARTNMATVGSGPAGWEPLPWDVLTARGAMVRPDKPPKVISVNGTHVQVPGYVMWVITEDSDGALKLEWRCQITGRTVNPS